MYKTHIFDQKNNEKKILLLTYLPYFFLDCYRNQTIFFSRPMQCQFWLKLFTFLNLFMLAISFASVIFVYGNYKISIKHKHTFAIIIKGRCKLSFSILYFESLLKNHFTKIDRSVWTLLAWIIMCVTPCCATNSAASIPSTCFICARYSIQNAPRPFKTMMIYLGYH